MERRRIEIAAAEELRLIIDQFDLDRSGQITREEWQDISSMPETLEDFAVCGLDVKDADAFFEAMLAMHGCNEVHIDAFVSGCLRLRGAASSIDLHILLNIVSHMRKKVDELHSGVVPHDESHSGVVPHTMRPRQDLPIFADSR